MRLTDDHNIRSKAAMTVAAAVLALVFSSCGVDKYLNEGERVLNRNQVTTLMDDGSPASKDVRAASKEASKYITQQPNKRFLGVRSYMRLFCSTNPDDTSGWANFWRARGEAPVIYNQNAALHSAQQIEALMHSKGCFNTHVSADTHHVFRNEVKVNYTIHASPRYKIDEVRFRCSQSDVNDLLQQWKQNSAIHVGDYYDQAVLEKERQEIATFLQRRGYYYARSSLVHFYIDTTFDSRLLSVLVTVRLPETVDQAGHNRRIPLLSYRIDNIYIYPDIDLRPDAMDHPLDTLIIPYESRHGTTLYNFIYSNGHPRKKSADLSLAVSPRAISRSLYIFHGQTYRPSIATSTNNSLMALNNFKFTDISFLPSPNSTDTAPLLDARVRMIKAPPRRISLSFELTNGSYSATDENYNFFTSGNMGLGENLSYRNTNLFGGAEQLTIEQNLLIETPKRVFQQKERGFYDIFNSFESGGGITLDLPEFLLPFTGGIAWQQNKPHTLFNISTDYLFRTFHMPDIDSAIRIERIRLSSSFGYTWSHSREMQHRLLPINVSYNHTISGEDYFYYLGIITSDYRYFAQNYFILNTEYQFTYSNQYPASPGSRESARHDFDFVTVNVETAGNLLRLAESTVGLPLGSDKAVDYYQFFRIEGEYKHYFHFGRASTLVLRTLAGIGIPYGHSSDLPYERTFYGGGPTTMRAWLIRRLGPGDNFDSEWDLPISMGDFQLVANIEQRFPITGIFEGALFADIGNVWTLKQIKDIPRTFAVGTGLGLRANITFITLRLDIAFPLYDPGYAQDNRWLFQHFRWNKTVLNFGINYPF